MVDGGLTFSAGGLFWWLMIVQRVVNSVLQDLHKEFVDLGEQTDWSAVHKVFFVSLLEYECNDGAFPLI